jgi:hypothetical protein
MDVIGMFCEDIREEKAGTESLIGVLPDRLDFPHVPAVMPKLAIYIRAHAPLDFQPNSVTAFLRMPDDEQIVLGELDNAIVEAARAQAKSDGGTIIGIMVKAIASPFPVNRTGRIRAYLAVDGEEHHCGSLMITWTAAASTEIEQ